MLNRSKISADAVDELQRSQAFHDAVECLPVDRFEANFYGCKVAGQGMTVGIFNGNIGGTDDLDDFQQNPFSIPGLDVEGVFFQFFLFKILTFLISLVISTCFQSRYKNTTRHQNSKRLWC